MGSPLTYSEDRRSHRHRPGHLLSGAGRFHLLRHHLERNLALPHQRFILHRDHDVTGVSGTGVVAEGVLFSNGVVALQWLSEFPTSVVFHQRGMESVEAVHGHSGQTRIVFLDEKGFPSG